MVAPRATARSHVSSTRNAAPSPMTKPSRSTSNGRDALAGSGLLVSAPIRVKAAMHTGLTQASVPPATTSSAVPSRTMRAASPMAWAPVVQAVDTARFGPVRRWRMPTSAAVALAIIIGTRNGLTRSGPGPRRR